MAGAVIGALRVVLGADSAALDKGLKDAQGSLDKFTAHVSQAGRLAAAGFVLAAAGLSVAIKGTLQEADKLGKLAQSVGVPVEELSKLKHAADLSGVGIDDLGKSMGKLSKNMALAAANPLGEAADAFENLGVRVRNSDGTLKSSSELMLDMADRFSKIKDGAAKTALAIQIFGRSGAAMIPMLNAGRAGIKALMLEAEQLGIVIDDKTAKSSEAFNDNLTRLKKVQDGIVLKLTAEMLPALERFSQFMIDGAKNSDLLKGIADGLSTALNGVMRAAILVYDNFGFISAAIKIFIGYKIAAFTIAAALAFVQFANAIRVAAVVMAAFNAVKRLSMRGIVLIAAVLALAASQFDNFKEKLSDLAGMIEGVLPKSIPEALLDGLKAVGFDLRALEMDLKGFSGEAQTATTQTEDLAIANSKLKKEIDAFLNSQAKRKADLEAEIQTLGLSEGAHTRLKTILEAEAIAKANNTKLTDEMRAKVEAAANANGMLTDKLALAREKWEDFKSAVLSVRSSLENAFVDAITQAKSFKDVIKSLISDLARLAAQSAFRSLFGGQLAWSGLAGSLFGGSTGNVGAASTGFGAWSGLRGFATGGSFQVGGSGGIDSQLVAFKASPNERVSITKPGQDTGGVGAAGVHVTAEVFVNDDGKFDAKVVSIADRSAASTVQSYDKQLPDRFQQIQQAPRRR